MYFYRAKEANYEITGMATQSERFSLDFLMGGVAAIISKSAAAPIERVKLLLQNQGEMIKRGQLKRPYTGVRECFGRVLREEGLLSFWRGNQANVIRYFPTQVFPFTLQTSFIIKDLGWNLDVSSDGCGFICIIYKVSLLLFFWLTHLLLLDSMVT